MPNPLSAAPSPLLLLGAGRLGIHLAVHLLNAGVPEVWLWNRTPLPAPRRQWLEDGLKRLPETLRKGLITLHGPLKEPDPHAPPGALSPRFWPASAALILLTVADDALPAMVTTLLDARTSGTRPPAVVAPQTKPNLPPVLHCSGALSLEVLRPLEAEGWPIGALHPLQSFSGTPVPGSIAGTWFALEGESAVTRLAASLVSALNGQSVRLKPGGKMFYHASAVMASNLMVALTALAVDLLGEAVEEGVTDAQRLNILLPLIEGTVQNLRRLGLPTALTGPVSRGDAGVVTRQLQALRSLDQQALATRGEQEHAPSEPPDIPRPPYSPLYAQLSLKAVALAQARGLTLAQQIALLHALQVADKD